MRITQNAKPHEKPQEMTPEEEEEYGPATRWGIKGLADGCWLWFAILDSTEIILGWTLSLSPCVWKKGVQYEESIIEIYTCHT